MGWLRTLFGFGELTRPVEPAAPAPSAELVASPRSKRSASFGVEVPAELLQAMTQGDSIAPAISREQALQVPAVLRARNLVCGTLAGLPIRFHDATGAVAKPTTLLTQIDPDIVNVVTMAQTYEDLFFESVAWWRVTRFGWHGYPEEAIHVPHSSVHVAGTGDLPWISQISPDIREPRTGQVLIDGIPVPDNEIIRFDSPNPPLLRAAARAIRTCLKLDRTANRYADDPLPLGYFTDLEGEEPLEAAEVEKVLDDWESALQQRNWPYVGGLKAQTLAFNAEQIQLADQRQHAVLEIARATGIDPEDLGVSVTSRTYQNGEARRLSLLDFTLNAYLKTVEQRLSMGDVTPRGYEARGVLNGFLRSDSLTRMNTYKTGLEVGAYADKDEVRQEEGKPPLTSAQKAASKPAAPPAQPQQTDQPDEGQEDDTMANQNGRTVNFAAAGESVEITFDAPEIAATFRVNEQKRTISGLIIPWGKIADNGIARWRFVQGSLHWSDPSRVKLNLDHDHRQAIAKAVRIQDTSAGLDASFQVARGAEGDRALTLAQDGVLDGFSVEVFFDEENGYEIDPDNRGVRLVTNGNLRGVALTAMPAFDDARVSAVAASVQQKGKTVETEEVTQDASAAFEAKMTALADKITASHETLTKDLATSIGDSISEGVKAALEQLPSPQDGPQPVRAARYTVTREAPIYSFNGIGPSLVRDGWYASREHDADSIERLRKYRVQQGDMAKLASSVGPQAFAPQSTGTASQIIPPGYRPDLYVPQLSKGRPLVSLCSRGTIDSATPFLVPKFGTATGVSADHVEGTNPSDGSLTFTEGTVAPGAVSGRLTLTREIVDSSNPAIDQIALATMRESYEQQTEAKVNTALQGVATTFNTVSLAALPGTTDLAVTPARDLLAKYPFIRFAAPTGAAMSQKITQNFAGAKGSDGRPLLPSVGATNTAGLGNAVTQGWFVDGLAFTPAWALPDAAIGNDAALIVNSMDVWVWESPLLSFRFDEKQGPANIEFNVFAYFAVNVLRPAGVFALRLVA